MQVPPGYSPGTDYRLRVEGYTEPGGAAVFTNQTRLQFSDKFLSITISTNKLVFTAVHTVSKYLIPSFHKTYVSKCTNDTICFLTPSDWTWM